jgi:hypothetical protein
LCSWPVFLKFPFICSFGIYIYIYIHLWPQWFVNFTVSCRFTNIQLERNFCSKWVAAEVFEKWCPYTHIGHSNCSVDLMRFIKVWAHPGLWLVLTQSWVDPLALENILLINRCLTDLVLKFPYNGDHMGLSLHLVQWPELSARLPKCPPKVATLLSYTVKIQVTIQRTLLVSKRLLESIINNNKK